MSFLLPQFLWGLLGLIPLAVVYLIKVHPVRKKTSAWFLWQGIFQEHRAASFLQKLRDWLSLLLMALAFIFMVLSLAQPVLRDGASASRLVLIVDNSLSMQADGRLDAAQRAAREWVRSLPAGGRAAIFTLSGELISETGFTASRRELMHGLDRVAANDVTFNPSALSHFGRDGAMAEQQRILLFSDGCFAGELPESIELVKVGEPKDNVGLSAFDVRRIPGESNPLGVFFRVFSGAADSVEVDAVLAHGNADNIQRVIPLTLQPGLNDPVTLTLIDGAPGKWFLELEIDDALSADNHAFAFVPEPDPVRVAVRAPETHIFWQLCVESFGEGLNGLLMSNDDPHLELYRGQVAAGSAERLAVFAPEGESPFWKGVSGETEEAAIRVVLPTHPLMRFANLDGLVVNGVRQIEPPEQAVVLAETDSGIPLIYKTTKTFTTEDTEAQRNDSGGTASVNSVPSSEAGGEKLPSSRTAYVLNFDPALNHFFLHPQFPVLVWSLASELMELEGEPPASYRAGGAIFTHTDGRVGPLTEFGFHEIVSGAATQTVACSTAPETEIGLDNSALTVGDHVRSTGFPLSEWFLAAALLLLTLEFVLYHRRKVG
ncbi:hypothetical protein PDESU_04628 [Pontiella desulfatans]|uniref:VWFA domain-containing protein n=1 Tax=Pontiella desulfatans TaxID=2750659 RepID=A0A6C2U7H9_PONDE|nr:BatA and WFA domain-containing protein [Pontiella desulfatans]VGO16038.1 hypothetical protein PDESU_04628 [Pontiella desulfatans]